MSEHKSSGVAGLGIELISGASYFIWKDKPWVNDIAYVGFALGALLLLWWWPLGRVWLWLNATFTVEWPIKKKRSADSAEASHRGQNLPPGRYGSTISKALEQATPKTAGVAGSGSSHVVVLAAASDEVPCVIAAPKSKLDSKHPILNKTPQEIFGKLKGLTHSASQKLSRDYIDRWTALSVVVKDTWEDGTISIRCAGNTVFAVFSKEYATHVTPLEPGERIKMFGRIDEVERTTIWYRDCEVVND